MVEEKHGHGPPANGNATGVNAYKIDVDTFSKRLKALYSHWRHHKDDLWGSSHVLAIATPPSSEDLRYLKSSAANNWLLGYEFPETIMVFGDKQIHFLCSQKKASLLNVVKSAAKEAVDVEVVMHIKAKSEDGTTQMDNVVRAIRKSGDDDALVVGYIAREAPEGKFLEAWTDKIKSSGLSLGDITNGLADLFAVKDQDEIKHLKKAAYFTAAVMKDVIAWRLEGVIIEGRKVTHSSLMDFTEKAILDPAKVGLKLKGENVDICYPPIFQSGGKFDLSPSATSNDDNLYYDSASIIICAVGSRYNSYCSNVARTFLINSTSMQSKAYEVLLKAQEAAIGALKPGNKLSAVYQAAFAVVERDAPELLNNLTESAGTGIGLEFRESGLSLNTKNDKVMKAGMVFNVSLGFHNLKADTSKEKSKNFALLLADTVIVAGNAPEVVTWWSSKALKDVAYPFNEDEEEEEVQVKNESSRKEALYSKATLRSNNQEELRRQHQAKADSEEEKGKIWEELVREASNADKEKGVEAWEELEREASNADKEKGVESDSKKNFGKSRVGPTSAVPSKRMKFG